MDYGKKGVRAQQRALNSKAKKWERKLGISLLKLCLAAFIGVGICGIAAGIGAFQGILSATPQIRLSDVVAVGEATVVYDCEGNELDQYVSTNSNRLRVESMDELPHYLGEAFVAIEDERFYQHNGIDYKSVVRSGYMFLKYRATQGGSTITQQLLKNTVFTSWTSEGKNWIKKIKRKIQEQYLALEISKYYSKDEILLEYMNAINLGQNTLGVEAAAKRYFGKSAGELTLSECAVIACITQNPSGYNPISHPENNARRRGDCLNNMLRLGFITKAEYDEAVADTEAVYERIDLHDIDYRDSTTSGSYFSDAVYEQVKKDLVNVAGYNATMAENLLTSGGLRIESTMDPAIQAIADEEFANPENFPAATNWYLNYALTIFTADGGKKNFSKENLTKWVKENKSKSFNLIFSSQDAAHEMVDAYRTAMLSELGVANDEDNYVETFSLTAQPQAAMVIEDQSTGYVVAIIGGRGNKEGRRTLNRATSSTRSPGSTFKVLAAYVPALDGMGQTLATVYNDAPFNYNGGTPVDNWYKKPDGSSDYWGINSIRRGIEQSMNILAVKTITTVTPQLSYDYLMNLGFTTITDGVVINNKFFTDVKQPMALGGLTKGVTPYELNGAYAAIANMGTYVEPKLYSRVLDSEGNVILDNTKPKSRQVIKETTAFLLTSAMVDVVTKGTGTRCNFDRQMSIAGKTGSSTNYADVWFAGFTPYYTCTTWAGYDNNVGMRTREPNRESIIAQTLWRAVMKRIHENLPYESFKTPQGIVQADICSRSGLLPIPGLCDACIKSELFAEGTVPVEYCNVHYEGDLCAYDNLPATEQCPFKTYGRAELPLLEDASLIEGSTMITENPDGTVTVTRPRTSETCQHDDSFFANPNYEAVINAQQWEINQRNGGVFYPDYEDNDDEEE